jgi:hypothetical protein
MFCPIEIPLQIHHRLLPRRVDNNYNNNNIIPSYILSLMATVWLYVLNQID